LTYDIPAIENDGPILSGVEAIATFRERPDDRT